MSSSRKRLLRLFLTGTVVLLLAGYGAFTTFFFNPFESDYEFDVATLVPRDVDFFTAKAGLAGDFDPFPAPAFADEFAESEFGQVLQGQAWYRDFMGGLEIEQAVASLEEALSQAPVSVEPLQLFGGEDLALAGYFEGAQLADARWALLGRTGWIGKFGVELLDRPAWIGLDAQGIVTETVRATIQSKEQDVGVTLSGGSLTQPLTIGRVQDVVVIASDAELVAEVARLNSVRGENSFGLSAKFADRIDVARREGDEVELFVDAVKLLKALAWEGAWPDRTADTFLPAFLGRLFQVAYVNEVAGRIDIDGGITLDLDGQMSSELLGNVQKRLYRQRDFDRQNLRELARLAPADVGMFAALRGDVGDLLGAALESMDQSTVSLMEDTVRDVWGYQDPTQLITDIEDTIAGRVAFLLRVDDYPPSSNDPPNNGATVLAWALAFEVNDAQKLAELQDRISKRPQAFGLEPLNPGESGIYTIPATTGSTITEYMNPLVPGTGQLATLELTGRDSYLLVSNSRHFLSQIDQTYFEVEGAQGQGLLARTEFEAYLNSGLPSISALAWLNPRAMGGALRTIAEEHASLGVNSRIDWKTIRPGVERDVLRAKFGNASSESLTQSQREEFEMAVNMQLDEIEREKKAELFPQLRQEAMDRIALWEGVRVGLLELSLDEKRLAFHTRLAIPLEPVGASTTP